MLDFLKNLGNVEVTSGKKPREFSKQELNPTNGADIRLFKDGRVYPSAELVKEFELEYTNKDTVTGNGFDVIDTRVWKGWTANNDLILIASTPKDNTKVDMFGTTNYKEDGSPASSVLTQGATTFGKKLITMLEELYGVELFKDTNNVDLMIARDYSFSTEEGIYYIPKAISRGEDKGTIKVVRREYSGVYPLVIFEQSSENNMEESSVENEEQFDTLDVFTPTETVNN